MNIPCGVCGVEHERSTCHIVTPTEAERASILAAGQEPLAEYVYCQPCWRTLSNPVSGPAMMKGLVQIRLRQAGVFDAEKFATKFHRGLIEKIKPRS